ncbi:protein of unknown function DUF939 [Paenibacillus curdlanolyticus YK9]|uniref:Putative aromatic acid exporter C-terminal domain-containing protein n=1 Tax=Paenibacillus curdlanolyticus YK9 TaxID=717606 RepID=E0I518_9BACL|nr:aromatic acid exporter family protein [Paenibacillus curdlanolyticus]EFM12060.1 protein of unknown function DUF939 [Paenibacillus curdlanolyticus YK9]
MGIRVIKTALAALAAIYTAAYFDLSPPLSAGILAILGVEVTRMKGLKSSLVRFVAAVLGLFLASILFVTLGFHIWAVSLFILVTFPLLARFQLKDGIVTSSVIVFHIFDHGEVTTALIRNEIMLLLAGLGWATIINLIYMPTEEKRLAAMRSETERLFGEIFRQMAHTLRDPAHVWDGNELLEAHKAIDHGIIRAAVSRENRFGRGERYWEVYFLMRKYQLDSIQQMLVLLAFVYESVPQGEQIAELLESLMDDVKSDVYEGKVEERLTALENEFRSMDLPQTRKEFEVRASLFQLCRELERYLATAKRSKRKKSHVRDSKAIQ